MRVAFKESNKADEIEVEFFVVGDSFALEKSKKSPLIRIGPFTPSQWKLIERAARERSGK